MFRAFKSFHLRQGQTSSRKLIVFLSVLLPLLSALMLMRGLSGKSQAGCQHGDVSVPCTTRTPTPTCTPTPITTPEFGSFEPSIWVTGSHTVTCSIKSRDRRSGLDNTSARYRWSSSGPEHLEQQEWLSTTVSGHWGTTQWQTIAVTIPFTQDSSSHNLVQFAITNTAGRKATSPIHCVQIDTTPPGPWWGFTRIPDWGVEVRGGQLVTYTIMVSDTTSGLDCDKASYKHWTSAGWSDWKPAVCTGTVGITTPQVIGAHGIAYLPHSSSLACANENKVEFRVADTAGHFSSALLREEYCIHLPVAMRCYPPCLGCYPPPYRLPQNGDFAVSENGYAAYWNREFFSPLFVDHRDQHIIMGYDNNDENIALPEPGGCVVARLYQDFYLPSGCHNLWLQFTYRLFSYDHDRTHGDAFLVYLDDEDGGARYQVYYDRSRQLDGGQLYYTDWITRVELLPASLGGGPVRLLFEVRQCETKPPPRDEAWWPTWVYLDDVIIVDRP